MPYISDEGEARRLLTPTSKSKPLTPGELQFQVACLVDEYVRLHGLCYDVINDVVGALEGGKLEFYRRVAGPYEDQKMAANGDVYVAAARLLRG